MKIAKTVTLSLSVLLAVLLTALTVLLLLGFRFSSSAAVHERYRDGTRVETDDYDFYLLPVKDEHGNAVYIDSFSAVKKYGFLYRKAEAHRHEVLTAENGDYVGVMKTYEGKAGGYHFISWAGHAAADETGTSEVFLKYMTDGITVNGVKTELYLRSYFKSEAPLLSLATEKTVLTRSDEWERPAVSLFAPKPADTALEFWITQDMKNVDLSSHEEIEGWIGAREYYGKGYGSDSEYHVKYLITAYPDYADGGAYVTEITVTDPAVSVYGLTVTSSAEEFKEVFGGMDFALTEEQRGAQLVHTAKKHGISFSLYTAKDTQSLPALVITADVTNKENISY